MMQEQLQLRCTDRAVIMRTDSLRHAVRPIPAEPKRIRTRTMV
jgi:hypothetical protein